MKILIINSTDAYGGAAKAAYRLHCGLLKIGIDSQMFVQKKTIDDHTVIENVSFLQRIWSKFRPLIDDIPLKYYKNRTKTYFSTGVVPFSGIKKAIEKIDPDIVHLHWLGFGMIKIEDISSIKKPIIWSLHDAWPFTGVCHYTGSCNKYKKKCGKCPELNSEKQYDLSAWIFKRKKKTYERIDNLTIVGLSKWITDCAIESNLFMNNKVINFPNAIDSDFFKPIIKKNAKNFIGIKSDKKIILFGAIAAASDPRKGFGKLVDAIESIKTKNVELLVFGSQDFDSSYLKKYKINFIGNLHDDISLKIIYNAADVVVVPSLQENLSNIIMESLSCGTPVVAFNIGGNYDMIDHKCNGYLAKPFDAMDIAKGIDWVLNKSNIGKISKNARKKILDKFTSEKVALQYKELYQEILAGNRSL